MASTTLPPIVEAPQLQQARDLRAEYQATVDQARGDYRLSDLAEAETIDAAWHSIAETLPQLRAALLTTYKAQMDNLSAVIPIGPNVPVGSSPADEAALHAAFRVTLTQARDASRDDLANLYNDAVRFGDDNLLRAVLTTAVDAGFGEVVTLWSSTQSPTTQEQLADLTKLRDFFTGMTTDNAIVSQAFKLPEQPAESTQLSTIRAATAQAEAFAAQTGLRRRS